MRRMRLIRSENGEKWESVRLFTWGETGQVGDCKFSITPDGALMITTFCKDKMFGGGMDNNGKLRRWCASVTWLSHDGMDWGHVHACPTGFAERWVVRYCTTWFRGRGYSPCAGSGNLYTTLDGKSWRLQAEDIFSTWDAPAATEEMLRSFDPNDIHQKPGEAPHRPDETVLAFDPATGIAYAIARTHPIFAIIGTAQPPEYKQWIWRPTRVDWNADGQLLPAYEKLGVQMGGPLFKYLSNGLLLAAGRADASTPGNPKGRLTLFIVDRDRAILKRWGDFDGWSHYPGIVEHENELWITCGKQQLADPFEVYLLKVPMPQPEAR